MRVVSGEGDEGVAESEGASELSERSLMPPGRGAKSTGAFRHVAGYSKDHSLHPQQKGVYMQESGGVHAGNPGLYVHIAEMYVYMIPFCI